MSTEPSVAYTNSDQYDDAFWGCNATPTESLSVNSSRITATYGLPSRTVLFFGPTPARLSYIASLVAQTLRETRTGDGGVGIWQQPTWRIATEGYVLRIALLSYGASIFEARDEDSSERSDIGSIIISLKQMSKLPWDRIAKMVGVTRPAVDSWRSGGAIRESHRQRLLAVQDVLELAAENASQSMDLVTWLDTPRGPDGRTPAQLLESGEIGRARLLALAPPTRGVRVFPSWVSASKPRAFTQGRERPMEALPPELNDELLPTPDDGDFKSME